jgi:hypothetical protein
MISANMKAVEAAGLSFILGMKVPDVPCQVAHWRREHPGEEITDGHVFTQPWPAGPKDKRRDQVIYCTCKADRARRALHGIDEQVTKGREGCRRAGPGQAQPVHPARGSGQERQPRAGGASTDAGGNQGLQDGPGDLPGRGTRHRGLRHRLISPPLRNREEFQDVKVGPAGPPVFHRKRDSIEAHLTIVFAALAVSRRIEARAGWSISLRAGRRVRYRSRAGTGSARYAAHPAQKRVTVKRAGPRARGAGRAGQGGRATRCAPPHGSPRDRDRPAARRRPGSARCSSA